MMASKEQDAQIAKLLAMGDQADAEWIKELAAAEAAVGPSSIVVEVSMAVNLLYDLGLMLPANFLGHSLCGYIDKHRAVLAEEIAK
jgi:hypothetical protein